MKILTMIMFITLFACGTGDDGDSHHCKDAVITYIDGTKENVHHIHYIKYSNKPKQGGVVLGYTKQVGQNLPRLSVNQSQVKSVAIINCEH